MVVREGLGVGLLVWSGLGWAHGLVWVGEARVV